MPKTPITTDLATLGVPPAPGGDALTLAAQPPRDYTVAAGATTEYVAGGYFAPLGDYVRTLPKWIDPVQREYGLDIYLRMVETDPQIASCVDVYKSAVLADGWRLSPAQDTDDLLPASAGQKPRKASSDSAKAACDLCQAALDGMTKTPFDLFLRQMLDAMFQGHKVAEKVYRLETTGKMSGKYVLNRIKTKPHQSTAFVQDAYDNMVGILGLMPNVPFYGLWPLVGGAAGGAFALLPGDGSSDSLQKNAPSLLPRSKFCVLTWDGQDGSPQGRSLLRRAFTPWWWKENCYAIWGKFISKHADPSLVGVAAENANNAPDPSGSLNADGSPKMLNAVQAMSAALANFQNGSFIALPYGADVKALAVANDGTAIEKFAQWCNTEIAKAILGQTLSTEQAKFGTKGQGEVQEHTKDDVTRYGQVLLTRMVLTDILADIVLINYGPGSESLVPEFGLGQEETMSFADFSNGASLIGYTVDQSQFVGMDEMGGLPPRDESAWRAKQKAALDAATAPPQVPPPSAANPGAAVPPSQKPPDKAAFGSADSALQRIAAMWRRRNER